MGMSLLAESLFSGALLNRTIYKLFHVKHCQRPRKIV
jgi:hypothetical protein